MIISHKHLGFTSANNHFMLGHLHGLKSRAAVDYTLIGVEPHGPTRGVRPIAAVAKYSQSYLVTTNI